MKWHAVLGPLLVALLSASCHRTIATSDGQPDLIIERVVPARDDHQQWEFENWNLAISIRNIGTASVRVDRLMMHWSRSQANFDRGEFGQMSVVDARPAVLAPGDKAEVSLSAFVEPGMQKVRLLVNWDPELRKFKSSGLGCLRESDYANNSYEVPLR